MTDEESRALSDDCALSIPGLTSEMIFDGAQCIRIGRDVLVNVANSGHELGLQWLRRVFGDVFVFHRLERMADTHIDSTIVPLRPGLWLVRDRRYIDMLPDAFRRWDWIVAPEPENDLFPSYDRSTLAIASKFIDMNVLSINENTVIVNALYPELVRLLERSGFQVIAVRHRHRRLFGGGFHCFTLDVKRAGELCAYV